MGRLSVLGASIAMASAAVGVGGAALAAGRTNGLALPRAVLPQACAGIFQQMRGPGGRLGGPGCGGLLALFDYGPNTAPPVTYGRLTASPAAPASASAFGGLPPPPTGTVPLAYVELSELSSAATVRYAAPAADHSLIVSPLILRGARYELIGYAWHASGAAGSFRAVYESSVYAAVSSGVLHINSPLADSIFAQPMHVYFELLRTLAPAGEPDGDAAPAQSPRTVWKIATLHHFTVKPDGQLEWGGLLLGRGGVLYGTATSGGSYGYINTKTEVVDGYGTIFEIIPPARGQTAYTTRVIHSFTGAGDGKFPYGSLIADKYGRLYGITTGSFDDAGSVFRLSPPAAGKTTWDLVTLHKFTGKADGGDPSGDLIFDPEGNLYGTTVNGGFGCNGTGCGTVFELSPPPKGSNTWTEKVLYAFDEGADGAGPAGGLARSASGVLYGLTEFGGNPNEFAGTAFALTPPSPGKIAWGFHLLHTFSGESDGGTPYAAPILDAKGSLYATTVLGGSFFEGTVFKLTPPAVAGHAWVETVLHDFGEGKDGVIPHGTLIFDKAGALYGTALAGGTKGLGMVFKLTPPATGQHVWSETELTSFAGGTGGDGPNASLIFDGSGSMYGTTSGSRLDDHGTVFELTP
jgi:hypothetical protein